MPNRAGGRTVDLGGPSVYQGRPKFEIMNKSCCLQKSGLFIEGAKHVDWGPGPSWSLLTPALMPKNAKFALGPN